MQDACALANKILKVVFADGNKPAVVLSALGLAYASACRAANMPDDVAKDGVQFFLDNIASYQEAVHAVN